MSAETIDLVLAVFADPSHIADCRERPLPEGIGQVIRVAAGEAAALNAAISSTRLPKETLVDASVFFLQQILFAPTADSYRVLGSMPDASQDRLRENYRWLMKWLHPDHNQDGWEAVYADRVNIAWQDLKTLDRRRDYDHRLQRTLPMALPMLPARRHSAVPAAEAGPLLSGATVRKLPAIVLGSLGTAALMLVAALYWAQSDTQRQLAEQLSDRQLAATEGPADLNTASGMPLVANAPVASGETAAIAASVESERSVGSTDGAAASAAIDSAAVGHPMRALTGDEDLPLVAREVAPPTVPASAAMHAATAPAEAVTTETLNANSPRSQPPVQSTPVSATDPARALVASAQTPEQASRAASVRPAASSTIANAPQSQVGVADPHPFAQSGVRSADSAGDDAPTTPAAAASSVVASGTANVAPTPERADAEALVREFAAAYAAGDLARFDRLFSHAGGAALSRDQMRQRFKTTEMRYLEIHQLSVRMGPEDARASARFRDTYVPRGEHRAVTESGVIEWVILVDSGDARIATFDRNLGRP